MKAEDSIGQPGKQGHVPPVVVPEDGSSRLTQMMREYARGNGGLWPYFNK